MEWVVALAMLVFATGVLAIAYLAAHHGRKHR